MKSFLTILCFCVGLQVWAGSAISDTVRVRLFSDKTVSNVQIRVKAGHYVWVAYSASGELIDTVADASPRRNWMFDVRPNAGQLALNHDALSLGKYSKLKLVPTTDSAWYLIKGSGPERVYEGALEMLPVGSEMLIVGEVGLNSYVAGVVESEGGHFTELEYFKAQAVLARTWLLANWKKHLREGYNVKDDVSSQAYYSMAYLQNSSTIRRAVRLTGDSVLVDDAMRPILGVFHANSGGQTSNSEDVWSGRVSYLRSVTDTFSLEGEKAIWTKTLDKEEFVSYVAGRLGISARDATFRVALLEYKPLGREGAFSFAGKSMKWRDVRSHFRLRSSWFSVEEQGSKVVLHGKGFGHGVGLSQEGARNMAQRGFNYRSILQFYFQQTRLMSLGQVLN